MGSWAVRYDIDPTKVVAWIDIPWRPDDKVCVLPFCLIQGGMVLSDCDEILLAEYLDGADYRPGL